ncbi:cysteine--tRNA ligase [Iningainema tapete]|uniref:Cysteine--tRNA ligase n=1 Tax=Iningainema tapete BLCC-T55 TaxID=2748662 RepID=A0A8J6XQP2_9CYAN|nr:cysteine--tRNA ligase [Iningainema tapete]MBD2774772.1 cysteine--tRNA ligase [Iningainema tapete BLCC-T55]
MTLSVYNTLSRRQEPFTTVEPGIVKMYCCGVTVYDYCHLGHARSYIVWDTIRRYLQWRGYQVLYIQNFTDIDDKILNRAKEQGSTMEAVANRFIDAYFEDIRRLNVTDADAYPRATEHIPAILELIKALEAKDYAYAVDGDVYYRVERFPTYGKLFGQELEQKLAGASGRVDLEDTEGRKKQHPFDFALWKAAKPGEPAWESPWGKGRPGWHIECSAMIHQRLGETIDIHGGGRDLIFPHHENEIAQSEAASNKPLARYWMHNGMVMVNGQKMSKSLGNFTTIRDLLDKPVDPMAVRLFVLQAHYRKPLDFTDEAIATATHSWKTLKEGLLFGEQYGTKLGFTPPFIPPVYGGDIGGVLDKEIIEKFEVSGDDDFNFTGSLAVLAELAKKLQKEGNVLVHEGKTETSPTELQRQWNTLVTLAQVLGLFAKMEVQTPSNGSLSEVEVEEKIQLRQLARKQRNFAEADRIRDELQQAGITLIDSREGTRWHRN